MSAVHYKFSSSNDYKNVTFDGLNISVVDCKKAIMENERLKMTEVDLRLTDAQTLKDYQNESDLIPKNSALLVRRIPVGGSQNADKSRVYVVKKALPPTSMKSESSYLSYEQLKKTEDLAAANASEQDKIKAMMDQATIVYDPSKYMKPTKPGSYQRYDQSVFVKCHKCNQTGHYASHCRLNKSNERHRTIRQATGIPRSHMVQVTKDAKGAMLTPDGQYVVPFIDKKGYEIGKKEKPPFLPDVGSSKDEDDDDPVPDELICLLCKEIMEDAVLIPCCGNSCCDECIRNALLESEDHECPTCHSKNISPDSLVANKFLRQAVTKFRNETGISRKKNMIIPMWPRPALVETKQTEPVLKPMKVTYGRPKPSTSSSTAAITSGEYVVKARSAQIYAAAGYTIKKASNTVQASGCSLGSSSEMDKEEIPALSEHQLSSDISLSVKTDTAVTASKSSDQSEKKINPVNMMVDRPHLESSPPPPPPPQLNHEDLLKSGPLMELGTEASRVKLLRDESLRLESLKPVTLPSLIDEMQENFSPVPVVSHEINITLKNLPITMPTGVEASATISSSLPENTMNSQCMTSRAPVPVLIEPPMHIPMPAQRQLGASGSSQHGIPLGQQGSKQPKLISPQPMLSLPSEPAKSIAGFAGMHTPSLFTGVRLPRFQNAYLPNLSKPPSMPPPIPSLSLRTLPPHLPFPPPPGVPPPGFIMPRLQNLGSDLQSNNAPPPPGTGTPPVITKGGADEKKRDQRYDSLRSNHKLRDRAYRWALSPQRSKLAIMSDEFTREQKERTHDHGRKSWRSSPSPLSGTGNSCSSSSNSSRRSSRSSYFSSDSSSSYSSSRSPSRSHLAAQPPSKLRKYRRTKRSGTRSLSRSVSPPRKKQSKKTIRCHEDKKLSRYRRSRSSNAETGSRRRKRYKRSSSRGRRRIANRDEVIIPGMPPQSVLDYERDVALYEYYKQKYERDWLCDGILPPSPFKRFTSYDPTKVQPPFNYEQQQKSMVPIVHPSVSVLPRGLSQNKQQFSQPPPPGDATPTEDDSSSFLYRPFIPDSSNAEPISSSWYPPDYSTNTLEHARAMPREDYYSNVQVKHHREAGRNRSRHSEIKYGHHSSAASCHGSRNIEKRSKRNVSVKERIRERGEEQFSSLKDSPEYKKKRDSNNGDGRLRMKTDRRKDSFSSGRDETYCSSNRYFREKRKIISQNDYPRRTKKSGCSTKELPAYPELPSEPFPPGEGDSTPVRDESREEYEERVNNPSKHRLQSHKKSRQFQTKDSCNPQKLQENNTSKTAMKYEKLPSKVIVTEQNSNRSPTPTLDENMSPLQFDNDEKINSLLTQDISKEKQRLKGGPGDVVQYKSDKKSRSIKSSNLTKSKWDSDAEIVSTPECMELGKKQSSKERLISKQPTRLRKVRIKRADASLVFKDIEDKRDGPVEEPSAESIISKDFRRVVVCEASKNFTGSSHNKRKESVSSRRSISAIDEAMFEPDYNDEASEKALSNFAPSDIEDNCILESKDILNDIKDTIVHTGNLTNDEISIDHQTIQPERSYQYKKQLNDEENELLQEKARKKKKKRKKHKKTKSTDENQDNKNKQNNFNSTCEEKNPTMSLNFSNYSSESGDNESYYVGEDSETKCKKKSCSRKWKPSHYSQSDLNDDPVRRQKKKSVKTPKVKKRKILRSDEKELSLDDECYSPSGSRKRKKKQKRKKRGKEYESFILK